MVFCKINVIPCLIRPKTLGKFELVNPRVETCWTMVDHMITGWLTLRSDLTTFSGRPLKSDLLTKADTPGQTLGRLNLSAFSASSLA